MPTLWSRKCSIIVCLATAVYGLGGGINKDVIRSAKKARRDMDATGNIVEARTLEEERAKAARRKRVLDELKADVAPDSHLEIQALQQEAEEEQGHQMREARTDSERELVGRRDEKLLMRREKRLEKRTETEAHFEDDSEHESESLMEEASDSTESSDAAQRARIVALRKRNRRAESGRYRSLEESVDRKTSRDGNGCRTGKEEFYGGLCYRKCPKFRFNSQGDGNAAFSNRIGPNACQKTVCNPATEDEFGGKCYKACSDLVKHYTIRKGPTKCGAPEGNTHRDSGSYNTGFGPGNAPIDIVDVAGPDCGGNAAGAVSTKKTECCLGYNTNDDDTRPSQCPYQPNLGECHEAMLGKNDILYRGCQRKTRSGRTCQRWNSQTPHAHSNTPINKPGEGVTSNYCRNPDHDMTIWCYTMDPNKRFEWCDALNY